MFGINLNLFTYFLFYISHLFCIYLLNRGRNDKRRNNLLCCGKCYNFFLIYNNKNIKFNMHQNQSMQSVFALYRTIKK